MARTKEQSELMVPEKGNTAVSVPASVMPMDMDELSDGAPQLSRLVMFNGTAQEEEAYGEHKKGMYLDALESRELGMSVRIAVVMAWRTFVKWPRGQRTPEYIFTNKSDVPPEDLEFGEDGTPPAATECINAVVVVEGEEWPYLFIFKKTGLKAFRKCIAPIEKRRAMTGKSLGLYELSSVDDKNSAGEPYKRITAKAVGDPSPELMALVERIRESAGIVQKQAQKMAEEQAMPEEDDGIPI